MTGRRLAAWFTIFTAGVILGSAAGVLASFALSRTQPDNVPAGLALGAGGALAGLLLGTFAACRLIGNPLR
jgi:hypothetical protein